MNMYLFELKSNRKFAITWLIVILVFVLFELSFYPIINRDMGDFIKVLNNLPDAIKTALGMDPSVFGSILGFYAFVLTFVFIATSIEAMILGLSIFSKEIREKTADFLLSKPVSRTQIVMSKVLASLTIILLTNIIFLIGFYFLLVIFSTSSISLNIYILLTLIILFIQLIFFSLGSLIAVIMTKIKAILTISLGTVFGLYLLSTFTDDKLRILMPFKYFDITKILLKQGYELKYIFITLFIIIIAIASTFIIYKKKDIHTV